MATVENVLSSVFSTIPELHSGQLGVLAGVVVGLLYWHGYRQSSLVLLAAFYLLALGIVPASARGLTVVQSKPWYFCSFLVLTSLTAMSTAAAWARLSLSTRPRSLPDGRKDV
ncbi:hypothetical protein [Natrinema salaciae]|uniref:Uncharacterized protein n=1 Tax=Natrinema salaciae TaxID=1186196 RepID=A0A1H9LLW3_9EURY|nr:hypothetical protein [Natrinema salaciae]SER12187.1 hypothetical protein SAMN04489841_3005 [Natrinema salaciae]